MKAHSLTGLHEVWEDGQAFKDLHARLKALTESKASIEAARKVCYFALLSYNKMMNVNLQHMFAMYKASHPHQTPVDSL